ncbi:MAG: NUDIX domain-containing protein [Candidatus Dojkabacteria bacterium]
MSTPDLVKQLPILIIVRAMIYNENNEFLILKRNDLTQKWELPGGKVERIDTLDIALGKEIEEETGLTDYMLDQDTMHVSSSIGQKGKYKGFLVIDIFYKARLIRFPEVKISDEHTSYKWITLLDLKKYEFTDFMLSKILLLAK